MCLNIQICISFNVHSCLFLSLFPLCPCSQWAVGDSDVGRERVSDRLCEYVYIHLFAQCYSACVRPTGVVRLSIVEVNKKLPSTKREQTAAVCSGFPNKHSTRKATDNGARKRDREGELGLFSCMTPRETGSHFTHQARGVITGTGCGMLENKHTILYSCICPK